MPVDFLNAIIQYLETTPVEVIGAHALFAVGWVPILGVLIWGLLELWVDTKQGQYWGKIKWLHLHINVPQDAVQTPKGMENFFNILAGSKSSITWKEQWLDGKFQAYFALEIVSRDGHISYYIRTPDKYRDVIEAAFYAQYPEAQITEVEDYLEWIPEEFPDEEYDVWGSEMTMRKPSYLPIKTYEMYEHQGEKDQRFKDPLLSFLEGMGKMRPGETYVLQILIMQPDEQDWVKDGQKYIKKMYGIADDAPKKGFISETFGWLPQEILRQTTGMEPAGASDVKSDDFRMFKLTPEERDQLDAIKEKISKIGWMTKIRFLYVAKQELYRKGTVASMTKGLFHQFAHQNWNKLGIHGPATPKDDYPWQAMVMEKKKKTLVDRIKRRKFGIGSTPFIFNVSELATMFHFPAADARTPVLTSIGARRSEAPIELTFAADDNHILPNFAPAQSREGSTKVQIPSRPQKLAVPTVTSPTGAAPVQVRGEDAAFDQRQAHQLPQEAPQPGMPAPLPPGLDISEQAMPSQDDIPTNLPLE